MKFLYLTHSPGRTPQTVTCVAHLALRRKQERLIKELRTRRPSYIARWLSRHFTDAK